MYYVGMLIGYVICYFVGSKTAELINKHWGFNFNPIFHGAMTCLTGIFIWPLCLLAYAAYLNYKN